MGVMKNSYTMDVVEEEADDSDISL